MNQTIKKVVIIGAGFMGTEIASRVILFGYEVTLFDIDATTLSKSRETLEAFIKAKIDLEIIKNESPLLDAIHNGCKVVI